MNATVFETKDYNKFELCDFNRDVTRAKGLESSMRAHGWITAYPLHCVRNGNGKFHIKAGHHRFEIARRLGLPIKYVVCDDTASIHELEDGTTGWNLNDYLVSHCRMGKEEYLRVKRYHESTGIQLTICISVLAGQSAGSGNLNHRFKRGDYRVSASRHAGILADIVLHCKQNNIEFATNSRFVKALSLMIWLPEFDHNHLKKKITTFPYALQKQPTVETFLQAIENVYNMQSRTKLPLAFNATQAARQRSAAHTN